MGRIASWNFSNTWQTGGAVLVALSLWFASVLVAGAYVTVFQPSGLTLWTLAVAGWCGVFAGHKACEFLFPHFTPQVVFAMFVVVGAFNPLLSYLNQQSGLAEFGGLAQAFATIATAYALYLHRDGAISAPYTAGDAGQLLTASKLANEAKTGG